MSVDYIIQTEQGEVLIETSTHKLRDALVDELVAERKRLGYTQQDVADKINIKRANLSRLEGKKHVPTLELLIKYADCLGLKLDVSLMPKNE